VVRAEQDLAVAANSLSLFLRDEQGKPVTVTPDRLPGDADALAALERVRAAGVSSRPDLAAILRRVDQSVARLALAENDLRARLDVRGEAGKDIGDEGLGGRSRTPFEAIVGVRFSIPLENRAAKGRVAEARAEIDALQIRSRYLREQIAVEVEGIVIAITAAERLALAASEEQVLSDRLAAAERRRFELGSSDFFLVNQREETAADAAVRLIDARARIAAARAELAAATGDLASLRLASRL
jgi:outer membrane protein TolC